MINKLIYKKAYKQVAEEMGLGECVVKAVYDAFWTFIKSTIEQLPLKEGISQEQFDSLKVNFNVPRLGKLFVKYKDVDNYNNGKRNKNKENKADVHRHSDNI